jgi:hypothetical protein
MGLIRKAAEQGDRPLHHPQKKVAKASTRVIVGQGPPVCRDFLPYTTS